jgi:hypothetical protein
LPAQKYAGDDTAILAGRAEVFRAERGVMRNAGAAAASATGPRSAQSPSTQFSSVPSSKRQTRRSINPHDKLDNYLLIFRMADGVRRKRVLCPPAEVCGDGAWSARGLPLRGTGFYAPIQRRNHDPTDSRQFDLAGKTRT